MDRVSFTMKIKPEVREEYLEVHRNVDSPLINEYRRLGVHQYAIYLGDDGTLFAYLECEDWGAFQAAVQHSPNQKAWGEKVYHLFDVKPDDPEGMKLLAPAFFMDAETP